MSGQRKQENKKRARGRRVCGCRPSKTFHWIYIVLHCHYFCIQVASCFPIITSLSAIKPTHMPRTQGLQCRVSVYVCAFCLFHLTPSPPLFKSTSLTHHWVGPPKCYWVYQVFHKKVTPISFYWCQHPLHIHAHTHIGWYTQDGSVPYKAASSLHWNPLRETFSPH